MKEKKEEISMKEKKKDNSMKEKKKENSMKKNNKENSMKKKKKALGSQNKEVEKKKMKKKTIKPAVQPDDAGIEDAGEPGNVYQISSRDGDFSQGIKKWIMEYHRKRPGLKILQENIDQFITAHQDKLEQERDQKLASASQDGWTVVVHHKGRKKTTDSETGITVGSVAKAAVEDKMAKKKSKEVGLHFYRFQRREAQRNEIMMLQSKFEEDKKRIQQLRAARKFRPY